MTYSFSSTEPIRRVKGLMGEAGSHCIPPGLSGLGCRGRPGEAGGGRGVLLIIASVSPRLDGQIHTLKAWIEFIFFYFLTESGVEHKALRLEEKV